MSSGQGWFESDEDYKTRVAREADERTIENLTGSAPSQGWLETDEDYRDRISREANESRIEEATGSTPSQGWFESNEGYRDRIAREANERTIEMSTGSAPSQGWFESDKDYDTRVRKEANERIVTDEFDSPPKQGWFEGDYEYRSRIAHEAREVRARKSPNSLDSPIDNSASASYSNDTDYSYSPSSSSTVLDSPSVEASRPSGAFLLLALIGGLLAGLYLLYSKAPSKPEAKPVNWAAPPKLSIKGLGPIRIGMSLTEARLASSDPLIHDPSEGEDCFYVKPSGAPEGLAFMVTNGEISRIDITSPLYSSISGARVGQTQNQVLQMYEGRLEVTGHQYDENGHYLIYTPKDIEDQHYRMVFETDGRQVTTFRAGKLPEVEYVEGCL